MDLLPGTLDLLILKASSWEPTHGGGVGDWIRLVTAEAFDLEDGSLYPALHRLEKRGFIESEWGKSDNNRRARFYQLTPAGRARLRQDGIAWKQYVEAVARAMTHGYPRALWAGERT
ncbi:MAG: PadR family transcriptional regulator [Gemmatimonadales bacterium]